MLRNRPFAGGDEHDPRAKGGCYAPETGLGNTRMIDVVEAESRCGYTKARSASSVLGCFAALKDTMLRVSDVNVAVLCYTISNGYGVKNDNK